MFKTNPDKVSRSEFSFKEGKMRLKHVVLGLTVVAMLAAPVLAGNVAVPLPGPGTMTVKAHSAFAEIFLEVTDAQNPLGLAVGTYNDVAIGAYDFNYDLGGGAGIVTLRNYVLYTGSSSQVGGAPTGPGSTLVAVNTLAAAQTGTLGVTEVNIGALLSGDLPGVRGRLYVGGIINTIENTNSGDSVTYNNGGISDTNPNPQLTFAVYNAYIDSLVLNHGAGATDLETQFVLSPAAGEQIQLDIWADATPDATAAGTPVGGKRYQSVVSPVVFNPELPVRDDDQAGTLLVDLDTGAYYDVNSNGWERIAFAGDPNDDDNVFWSFVGNPNSEFKVTESFFLGETFDAGFDINKDGVYDANDVILVSGSSNVEVPTFSGGLAMDGQFVPGTSLMAGFTNAAGDVTTPTGEGYGNALLDPNSNYYLTANFAFGGQSTGAYDSDPNTYTFQQGPEGSIGTLTQLTGTLGFIPEPMTMFALLMGSGGLVGYLRRRRNA